MKSWICVARWGSSEVGEEVMIARYGEPVARLVRVKPAAPTRRAGAWRDSLRIADDFNDAIDELWMEPLEPVNPRVSTASCPR